MGWNNPHFPVEGQWLTPDRCASIVAAPIFRHPLFQVESELELCLLVEVHHLRVFRYKDLSNLKQLRRQAEAIEATAQKLEKLLADVGPSINFPMLRGYYDSAGATGYAENIKHLRLMLKLIQPGEPARDKRSLRGNRWLTYHSLFHKHWMGEARLANDFIDLCHTVSFLALDDVARNTVRTTIIDHVQRK